MVTVSKETYSIFGNVVNITNGKTELKVTTDIGPRVIYLGFKGGSNFMYEDINDAINLGGEYFDKNFKSGESWHIYGGHRLWKSEEEFATYAPDNYPVEVEYIENGAVFTSAAEKMTGLKKSVKITMSDDGEITLEHRFDKVGGEKMECSLWALTVTAPNGVAYVPLSTEDTGWLSNRNLVLWSYDNVRDERFDLRNDAFVIKQDASVDSDNNLKIGTLSPIGKAYEVYSFGMFEKSFAPFASGVKYPDNMCNLEIYTSFRMTEIESLSPMYTLSAGDSATHTEKWRIYSPDSKEYAEISGKIKV